MVVKVTDANGNPIANKTVNWQLVSGTAAPSFDTPTTTDANGLSISRLFQGAIIGGNGQTPYLQSVINAYVDNASTNFTETVALTSSAFGNQLVFTQKIAPEGSTPLSGPAGGTGTDPIKIHIDGGGLGVPGVSVRILNPDPKTQPSASCATSPGADPGSVLSDANGDATCYPVFGPIAGNGPVQCAGGWSRSRPIRSDDQSPAAADASRVRSVHRHSTRRVASHARPSLGGQRQQSEHQSRAVVRSARGPSHRRLRRSHHREHGGRVDGISGGRGHTEPDLHHHRFHRQDADHRHLLSLRGRTGEL